MKVSKDLWPRVREEMGSFPWEETEDGYIIRSNYQWHPWVKGYFLSWGSAIEILEPDWIRQEMMDEYNRIFEKYQKKT